MIIPFHFPSFRAFLIANQHIFFAENPRFHCFTSTPAPAPESGANLAQQRDDNRAVGRCNSEENEIVDDRMEGSDAENAQHHCCSYQCAQTYTNFVPSFRVSVSYSESIP